MHTNYIVWQTVLISNFGLKLSASHFPLTHKLSASLSSLKVSTSLFFFFDSSKATRKREDDDDEDD